MIAITKKSTSLRPKKNRLKSALFLLVTVFLALAFRSFLFEPFHIPSGSMRDTLLEGDYIFVSKYAYGYSRYSLPFNLNLITDRLFYRPPRRGDIVVFKPPKMDNLFFVKRVIGLPGDTVQLRNSAVYINGKVIPRALIDSEYFTEINRLPTTMHQYKEVLDNGVEYHVLQDVLHDGLNNTPVFHVPADHFFVLGDNRNNSRDSRFLSEIGFIPKTHLVGRARFVVFSFTKQRNRWIPVMRKQRVLKDVTASQNVT